MAADDTFLLRASGNIERRTLRRSIGALSALAMVVVSLPLAIVTAGSDEPTPGLPSVCVPSIAFDGDIGGSTATVCPDAVGDVVAEPGNNEVRLSWTAPANAEAAGIVEYVVDVRTDRRIVTVPASQTSVVVSGLANGIEARLAVHAVGANGASAPSDEVSAVPTTGVEGEVAGLIIKFEGDVPAGDVVTFDGPRDSTIEFSVVDEVADDAVLVELPESVSVADAEFIAGQIADDPGVEWVEPDRFLFIADTGSASAPSDSEWSSSQWNLWDEFGIGIGDGPSKVSSSWSPEGGTGSVVAVVDTGITPHPELDNQIVDGYDFVSNPDDLDAVRVEGEDPVPFDGDYVNAESFGELGRDSNPADPGDWRGVVPVRDSSWHGTAMAGIIAAAADNGEGISGVAPGARVQPIRALSWRGGLLSDIAAAITWASGGAVDNVPANATPSNVINLSFAVEAECPIALQESIHGAIERGAVVVAAAGNANADVARFAPANCDGVVSVGATNRDGLRAPYSNWGEGIDVSAPGGSTKGGVLTTSNDGSRLPAASSFANSEGTSVAAAHVAAAAAIIRAADPTMARADVIKRLIGRDHVKKFGRVSCDADVARSCGSGILSLAEIAMVRQGNFDYSMTFARGLTYAQAADSSIGNTLTGAFTIEAWVKPTVCNVGDQTIVSKENQFLLTCRQTSGTYQVIFGNASGTAWNSWLDTGVAPVLNAWQHVAVTRSSGTAAIEFYFNGQLRATLTAQNTLAGTSNPLRVGDRTTGGNGFTGDIDEVRLYSTYRASNIATDMHTYGPILTSGSATPGLAAYYDFNEGDGTTVYNRVSGAASTSHLTTVGSPDWVDVKTTTTSGSDTIVTFPRTYLNAAGGWTIPAGLSTVQYLVVAGGGGGGSRHGGGGGAGGFRASSTSVTAGTTSAIIVGQGGSGVAEHSNASYAGVFANNGQDSSAIGITSIGGGRGSAPGGSANNGGSGGAAQMATSFGHAVGLGTAGQGNNGGQGSGSGGYGGGGGGGAGAAGSNAAGNSGGAGGAGSSSTISGSTVFYAGGGGGGASTGGTAGAGGSGGGGAGKLGADAGGDGAANTGGGGGAGGYDSLNRRGGSGGSGIVILRYTTTSSQCAPSTTTSGTKVFVAFKDVGSCRWTMPAGISSINYLVVAGGGGGGADSGGGGGAGGLKAGTSVVNGIASIDVTVGAGGAGGTSNQNAAGQRGANGGTSVLVAPTAISATGGGGGGAGGIDSTVWSGQNGGSGGGSVVTNAGSAGTGVSSPSREGYDGGLGIANCEAASQSYCGGGGGGAGGAGAAATNATTPDSGGAGGIGATWSELTPLVASALGIGETSASSVYFAGGGGGGAMSVARGGSGGLGGGGAGDNSRNGGGSDAVAATGGGGGAGGRLTNAATDVSSGGDGGSGVVVISYTAPTIDYAVDLNGTYENLRTDDTTTLGKFTTYTVQAWARPDTVCAGSNPRCPIVVRDGDFEIAIMDGVLQSHVYAGGSGQGWLNTGIAPRVGEWFHVALVRNGTAMTFYFNGVAVATQTIGSAASTFDLPLRVGYPGYGSHLFDGRIDEVKLWNVARSAAEILTDMHSYTAASATGLVAYYDFNDGTGTTVYNQKSGAAAMTNLKAKGLSVSDRDSAAAGSPTFVDVKTTDASTVAGAAVVTFPRSYITAVGGWRAPQGITSASVLVVGGGGGAGWNSGGGGSGGGVSYSASTSLARTTAITVGAGGSAATSARNSTNGGQSKFGSTTVSGGNPGASFATTSAGGASVSGSGAGGLGSRTSSLAAVAGGNGPSYSITGTATNYAGGGGGGGWATSTAGGSGGSGGGGRGGGSGVGVDGVAGTAGTGGGGGSGASAAAKSGAGGSGIVIVRYATASTGVTTTCTNPTRSVATDGTGDIIVAFTTAETCTWTPPAGVSSVNLLVVGGGGGGGFDGGGGGGGGAVLNEASAAVTPGTAVTLIVGAGGSGASTGYLTTGYRNVTGRSGSNGGTSSFGALTATGGGAGGGIRVSGSNSSSGTARGGGGGGGAGHPDNYNNAPVETSGGTGGVGCTGCAGGSSLWQRGGGGGSGTGNAGGNATGTSANTSGAGGAQGTAVAAFGTTVFGSGGGGGDWYHPPLTAASGGTNAGSGGVGAGATPTAGTANTGGGGGGGGGGGQTGAAGGSGVVMVRYSVVSSGSTTCTNPVTSEAADGSGDVVVKFVTVESCTWTPPAGVSSAQYLIVGGGGGGGGHMAGGGGGGEVVAGTKTGLSSSVSYSITVGTGGTGGTRNYNSSAYNGTSGSESSAFAVSGTGAVRAAGGGFGSTLGGGTAGSGGSGGGGGAGSAAGGSVSKLGAGLGFAGGNGSAGACAVPTGGGGGGAGAVGEAGSTDGTGHGGDGGNGATSTITGVSVAYAGGGGGGLNAGSGCVAAGQPGTGGLGGGGAGGPNVLSVTNADTAGFDAVANTGGGGGGASGNGSTSASRSGGNGGSGVVIIRYTPANLSCAPLSYTTGSYTVVEFQTAGTCAWTVPTGVSSVSVLAVGGGGGGGAWVGAGGGGGGVVESTSVSVTAASTIDVTVGAGGTGASSTASFTAGANGGSSRFGSATPVVASGGGVGASVLSQAAGGGSSVATGGGGATSAWPAGSATGSGSALVGGSSSTDLQPHPVGGGAGAGGNGLNGSGSGSSWASGAGGPGKISTLSGATVFYGGGGGGSAHGTWTSATSWNNSIAITPGAGGVGGGGRGGRVSADAGAVFGADGIDGLGGGGGGAANYGPSAASTSYGGDGGDGTVIVRYLTPSGTATITYSDNVAAETISVPSTQSGNAGTTVLVGAAPSRTGYTFDGWSTVADGSGTDYVPGDTLTLVSDETLYAQWSVNNYTLTYDDNVVADTLTLPCSSQTGNFGATLTLCSGPTRTGYTFSGWNTASGGTGTAYSAGASYAVTASSPTLYAQWTANSYTVSYNANGGTGAPSSSTVVFGQTATVSASTPTRTGHTFASWTTGSDGTGTSYASSATFTMGAANVTLYAKWTVNNYTVTYDDNVVSQTISVPSTQTAAYAGSVTVGSAPTRSGYTFAGWNTASGGTGTAYSAGASLTIPASNTTLYAQWTVNTHTVSYNLNGGAGTAPTSQTAAFDTSVTVASTSSTRTGFTFAGWNTDAAGAGTAKAAGASFTIPAANTTFYAQWTADQYTITFAANDDVSNVATGLPSTVTGRTYQQSVTLPSTEPTRPSYVFNGWNTAANGSGTSYAVSGALVMPAANVTLHAQWVPANFGVVYNANGGTGAPAAINAAFGSTVTISTNQPTRTGHTFRWWTTTSNGTGTTYRNPATGTSVSSFSMPGSQVTLYAQWLVNSYVITYNANLGSNAPASQNANYDTTVTASASAPTRAGYTFTGWNTAANGTGTSYAGGGTFQMPATDFALYAQWQANTYNVTYNVNGGGSAAPSTQSATTDSTITVSSTVPSRTGYNFAGWNTLASGLGTPRTSGGTFTMPASHVTLYVQWNPQTLAISYNGNGGTNVPGGQNGVVDSSVTISATVPTRTGYTFTGWNTAANGSGTSRASGATFVMPTTAVTLFAQWQAIPYAVTYEANNGTGAPTATSHTYLDTVTLSSTLPTRAGYWFNGWNTEANGSGFGYTDGGSLTMPAANVTLYAQWVADLYRVVYNANGGVDAPADQVLATDSTVAISSTVPTRVGFDFRYWTTTQNGTGSTYSNPAAGSAVDNFTMPPSNTTLYAQWAVRSYQFAYDANGGTGAPSGASTAFGATVTVSATIPTRVGHTFVGWNTSSGGTGASYVAGNTLSMPAGALTLHAQWTADNYSITYFANGGSSAPVAQTETYGTVASVSATPATRSGYTFDGWNTQADGLGTSRASGSSFTMSNANVDLYALWTAQTFAVSFNANGGSGSPANVTGATDSSVNVPVGTPTRAGYDFIGWNTLQAGTGTGYLAGSTLVMPPNNLTLWAQWRAQRFEIAYNVNGGATNPPVGAVAATGSSVQAAATTPTRTGYQFAGWNSVADGTGISATAGDNFSMPPGNVTLFAQWTPLNFRVTYDANGGIGAPTNGTAGTDTTFTVTSSKPTRTGHAFTGWNTRADGSGTSYAAAATFTMPPNDVALWAQWTVAAEPPATTTTTKPATTTTTTTTVAVASAPVIARLAAPQTEYVVSGRSVKIEPLKQAPPPGDAWDQSSMGVYVLGTNPTKSADNGLLSAVRGATRLKTIGGVWTVDRAKGTVSFVAADGFEGRERVGFVVTTKLGVEHRTTLTVKVRAARPDLPVSGNNVDGPIRSAMFLLVLGLFLCGLGRVRSRR